MKNQNMVNLLGFILVGLLTGLGCTETSSPSESAQSSAPAPTLSELAEASFDGIAEEPVRLSNGRFESPPFVEGGASRQTVGIVQEFLLVGDFDQDGSDESAAILWESSGGSGMNSYLAISKSDGDATTNIATTLIGDRVQLRDARVEGSTIVLEVIQAGPSDAACCPGDHVVRRWTLVEGMVEEQPAENLGRIGLGLIQGQRWTLIQEPVAEQQDLGIDITFEVAEGRISGNSGCNRFSANVEEGETPGSLKLGPAMGTRMACADEVMALERAFLQSFSSVDRYGFVNGMLTLSFVTEDGAGSMRFRSTPM